MSAIGYKQTLKGPRRYVRFTPNSGHSDRNSVSALHQCPLIWAGCCQGGLGWLRIIRFPDLRVSCRERVLR